MAVLAKSGRVVIAESIAARAIHAAWGTGDGSWTAVVPPEDVNASALMNEVGRHSVTAISYVTPNVAGEIVLPTGAFTASGTATNHLYVRVSFDFADATGLVIREMGLFVGSTMVGGLPGGQTYFLPAQVATPGRLLHLEHFEPIFRSPAIRESFEVVITF